MNWFKEIEANTQEIGIHEEEIKNREGSGEKVKTFKGFQE